MEGSLQVDRCCNHVGVCPIRSFSQAARCWSWAELEFRKFTMLRKIPLQWPPAQLSDFPGIKAQPCFRMATFWSRGDPTKRDNAPPNPTYTFRRKLRRNLLEFNTISAQKSEI